MNNKRTLLITLVILAFLLPAFLAPADAAMMRRGRGRRAVRPAIRPVIIAPRPVYIPPAPTPVQAAPSLEVVRLVPVAPLKTTQLGLAGGLLGGLPAVIGEVRFFEPFGLAATSLRLGAGYAAGNERKHALVLAEGIYHFNPPGTPGINSYVGGGLNYDAYTTGRVSGSVGGEVYYGLEAGTLNSGQVYAEVGYGKIRTGFSPSSSGLSVVAGVRY